MSGKVVKTKILPDGRTRQLIELDVDEVNAKVRETMSFLQTLCDNDSQMALVVAQVLLTGLKGLFKVSGEVEVMEHRPQ